MLSNNVLSALSQSKERVGVVCVHQPCLTAQRIKASRWFLSTALVKPHQAGEAYVTLASAVDWNTAWIAGGGMPWLRRVCNPYRTHAQLVIILSMLSGAVRLSQAGSL